MSWLTVPNVSLKSKGLCSCYNQTPQSCFHNFLLVCRGVILVSHQKACGEHTCLQKLAHPDNIY